MHVARVQSQAFKYCTSEPLSKECSQIHTEPFGKDFAHSRKALEPQRRRFKSQFIHFLGVGFWVLFNLFESQFLTEKWEGNVLYKGINC